MRKLRNVLWILFTALILSGVSLFFAGCRVDPYYLEAWYLDSYTDAEGITRSVGYDAISQTNLLPDAITIQYFEDGTFLFKEFDQEYTGTYSYVRNTDRAKTWLKLVFSDGSKGEATCAKYMFDGTWHEGTLQAFGKAYEFTDNEDVWAPEDSIEQVGKHIYEALKYNRTATDRSYGKFYKGRVTLRDGEYWFVSDNSESVSEENLSQANALYTYEVDEAFAAERGDNTLREGRCFFASAAYRTASGGTLWNNYGVWYYEDVFENVYPWAAELEQISSVRVECREKNLDSFCQVQIWDADDTRFQEFYELFVGQFIVKGDPLYSIAREMTYYIKTATQTYTVVYQDGWTADGYSCGAFVSDGQYYYCHSDQRIKSYFDGDYYWALEKNADGASLFVDGEPVKTYEDLAEELLFKFEYVDIGEADSKYVLRSGNNRLILLDSTHFIWETLSYGTMRCEVVGETDFSAIFEEFPKVDE